eukprot:Plantae.Rhodophyta-Purpureofilum_apyrenoidigerum.ctg622.p1 GENE.Plantae.Rhodophyta-Purpureofilum_apyrenoidigerum.ctg622~~Plantae.Rhodophyta-Purpureofilum_apyrenoidigerum.ctg622.p1  ORF type:complete len:650 (+),score=129.36 Plantae.Rhodophyta-Purpureofilum_apyrenoidigerum.ctg622:152-2101(+)
MAASLEAVRLHSDVAEEDEELAGDFRRQLRQWAAKNGMEKVQLRFAPESEQRAIVAAEYERKKLLVWRSGNQQPLEAEPEDGCCFVSVINDTHCFCINENCTLWQYKLEGQSLVAAGELKCGEEDAIFQAAFVAEADDMLVCLVACKLSDKLQINGYGIQEEKMKLISPIDLNPPDNAGGIMAVAVVNSCSVVLYSSGDIDIVENGQRKFRRALRHRHTSRAQGASVLPVTDAYFAVLFNGKVSIWDVKFGVGHAYIDLNYTGQANVRLNGDSLLVETSATDYRVTYTLPELTLAAVTASGAGRCVEIGEIYDEPPLGSMPALVTSLATAADAASNQRFAKALREAEVADLKLFKAVLNAESTPTAKALCSTIGLDMGKKLGPKSPKLWTAFLSERVAAAAAARCVYEISESRFEFVDPLAHLFTSGFVSASALNASYSSMSRKAGKSNDYIKVLANAKCIVALQELVSNVVDFSEKETVRLICQAVMWRQISSNKAASEKLIVSCVAAPFDSKRLTAALRLLPLTSALQLIELLRELVFAGFFRERRSDALPRNGSKSDGTRAQARTFVFVENGIEWLSRLLEAQFSSLILEKSSHELLRGFVGNTREARRFCETMEPIEGAIDQIMHRRGLPQAPKPNFVVETLRLQ